MAESIGSASGNPSTARDPETDANAAGGEDPGAPEVRHVLEDDVARVSVSGELTECARKPLVRTLTDLLLSVSSLRAVHLDLRDVTFMSSAGMAVLVQLQRMTAPRSIEVVLVAPPVAVARPLQLSGLWRRFSIDEEQTAP